MTDTQGTDAPIRISATEAGSSHVDDLLRRQANMRGDTGITRDRRGTWYYQSWFTLGLAGMFAAFLAWAIIEPYFDDLPYVQGKISASTVVKTAEAKPAESAEDAKEAAPAVEAKPGPAVGTIAIGGDTIIVGPFTTDLRNQPLPPDAFANGKVVGVYADDHAEGDKLLWLARFVDVKPVPVKGPAMTLEQLQRRSHATGMVIFALMAALIGLFVGAVDGAVCRMYTRAALSGVIGLGVGFLGGFILSILANLIYSPLNQIALEHSQGGAGGVGGLSLFGFSIQMMGRTIAWGMAGVAMGLGQGIALRSPRLLLFGLLGGVVGGVLGGLLFDPIDLLILGNDKPSAHVSRLVGFMVIGACVGGMIGVVELLARDAWLRMEQGPLAGKEFLVFKDVMKVGASPRSDIYLFNDPQVQAHHATLRMVGENLEIESVHPAQQVLLNDRPVSRSRLRHGDRIGLGRTIFVYQKRGG
jgi:hypothetical protein